jgi:hypothetical protein
MISLPANSGSTMAAGSEHKSGFARSRAWSEKFGMKIAANIVSEEKEYLGGVL